MKFTKMHGLGNDYVLVNCFSQRVDTPGALARQISDRHHGVGSDGLILICPSGSADVRMEIYNADGSRAQTCGNGIRCVAKYAYEHRLSQADPMRIETDAGVVELELTIHNSCVTRVRVDMGRPSLDPKTLPCTLTAERIIDRPMLINQQTYQVTCVSMGNPHAVVFVDDLDLVDLASVGPAFENAPQFPDRINVHFGWARSAGQVTIKTWERGSGATQACGTGACAVCVAGVLAGRTDRQIIASVPGGDLDIHWQKNDHVYMTGPAVEVFCGEFTIQNSP